MWSQCLESFILQVKVRITLKVVVIYSSAGQSDFRSVEIGIYNYKCYYYRVIVANLLIKNG